MNLIGIWKKISPISLHENIFMKFESNGDLIYQVYTGQKIQQINLTYRISGNKIISNQPSKPKEEITDFFFERDDVLVLIYNGEEERYLREYVS